MVFDTRVINLASDIWGMLFCTIGIVCTHLLSLTERHYSPSLMGLFVAELVVSVGSAVVCVSDGVPTQAAFVANNAGVLTSYLASYCYVVFFVSFVRTCLSDAGYDCPRWWERIVRGGAVGWAVAAMAGAFYMIGPDNVYRRCDLFWLQGASLAVVVVPVCLFVWRSRRALRPTESFTLLFNSVALFVAANVQTYAQGINLTDITVVVGLVLIFIVARVKTAMRMLDAERALAEAKVEAAESRLQVMVSQVRPHFLFNTLDTIYLLCDEDTERAKEAIDAFSTYLRTNLHALSNTEPIGIERELEHVRIYLYLEKMSAEDLLNYEVVIGATGFAVPELSVQTIVENAVKHGVLKRPEGGHVRVRTYGKGAFWYVEVEDDGVGFDVDAVLGEGMGHVGLDNARGRLETMCGGTLTISSVVGSGTLVRLRVPKDDGTSSDEAAGEA